MGSVLFGSHLPYSCIIIYDNWVIKQFYKLKQSSVYKLFAVIFNLVALSDTLLSLLTACFESELFPTLSGQQAIEDGLVGNKLLI